MQYYGWWVDNSALLRIAVALEKLAGIEQEKPKEDTP